MRELLITLAIASLSVCANAQTVDNTAKPQIEAVSESSLCVEYFHGSLGRTYGLILKSDHTYSLIRRSCEGEIGRATGRWSLDQATVKLRHIKTKNIPKAFPKSFAIRYREGVPCLVTDPNDSAFTQLGTCVFTAFCPTSREDFLSPEKPWPENPK